MITTPYHGKVIRAENRPHGCEVYLGGRLIGSFPVQLTEVAAINAVQDYLAEGNS